MALLAGIFDPQLRLSPEEKEAYVMGMAQSMRHRTRAEHRYVAFDDCRLALAQAGAAQSPQQLFVHPDGKNILAYSGDVWQIEGFIYEENEAPVAPTKILELMVRKGVDILPRLDGSYALAFYEARGALHLARDIFGNKPLYYLEHNGVLAFSSELRGLQTLPFFDPGLDMDALAEFISFQYVGAPRSIYAQIRKLPPGYRLQCGQTDPASTHRFFAFTPGLPKQDTRPITELAEDLKGMLARQLLRRCAGRDAVHVCLSGGVDSSTVAALAVQYLNVPVHTFSIGFSGTSESEHNQARVFAEILGTTHHERIIEQDVCDFLQRIGEIQDEPNGDSSCLPMFALASFMGEYTDIALAGDCADELFGGYGRYLATLAEITAGYGDSLSSRYYSDRILIFDEYQLDSLLGCVPKGYAEHLARLRSELDSATWLHPLDRMRRSDMENYAPGAVAAKADRMGMFHGVEMWSPFAAVGILRFSETLPVSSLVMEGRGKRVLREIAYKHLPVDLINAPKRGFGLPTDGWGRKGIYSLATELLSPRNSQLAVITGRQRMQAFLDAQQQNFSIYQVWTLCVLESFLRYNPVRADTFAPSTTGMAQWSSIDHAFAENAINHAFSLLGKPILAFINDSNQASAISAEHAHITYVHKNPLPGSMLEFVFDWENEKDWNPVRPYIQPETIVCFLEGVLPTPQKRRLLRTLGVQWVLVHEEGSVFLVTTETPSFRQRLTNMWRLARIESRKMDAHIITKQ